MMGLVRSEYRTVGWELRLARSSKWQMDVSAVDAELRSDRARPKRRCGVAVRGSEHVGGDHLGSAGVGSGDVGHHTIGGYCGTEELEWEAQPGVGRVRHDDLTVVEGDADSRC